MKTEIPQTESVPAVVQPPLVRLTAPQLATLKMLEKGEFVSMRYKPVDKLFKLKLAQLNIGVKQDKVGISEAGRAFLANA